MRGVIGISKSAIVGAVVLCLAAVTGAAPQDGLTEAKSLYTSAAYEDALSALTRLHESPAPPEISQQIDRYRVFCLVALGRSDEAESVTETLLKGDPLLEVDAAEASPRIETMFTTVRKRLLPGLIRERYRTARAAIEQKDFAAADSRLTEVRRMLDMAAKIGASSEGLDDLGLAVDGLLDLTRAAADVRVAGKPMAPARPATTAPSRVAAGSPSAAPASGSVASGPRSVASGAGSMVSGPGSLASGPGPLASSSGSASGSSTADVAGLSVSDATIYDSTSEDVTPPVPIFQKAPTTSGSSLLSGIMSTIRKKSGTISITIDENGTTRDVVIVESVQPLYDQLLVSAARNWKYQPAMKAGVPVKYRKSVRVEVQ